MSQTDADLAGEALEEGAWPLPEPGQIAETDIMQFVESVLPRLSIDHLTRLENAARETRHSKQEEVKQSARQQIEAQLQASGLSLRDLFPELLPGRRGGEPIPPKYRGPNGEIWSGRGHTPKWL